MSTCVFLAKVFLILMPGGDPWAHIAESAAAV